jgi:hypothetical protein
MAAAKALLAFRLLEAARAFITARPARHAGAAPR